MFELTRVKKRNGSLVPFDHSSIAGAIAKAVKATGYGDERLAEALSKEVTVQLYERFGDAQTIDLEDIQDAVEHVLIKSGHSKLAKAYILYRDLRRRARETTVPDYVSNLITGYTQQADWRVKENSNVAYSMPGLMFFASGTAIANYTLSTMYPSTVSQAHSEGDLHLHNLQMGIVGYCAGWSIKQVLLQGFTGGFGRVRCSPPKHMNTSIWQMVNFLGCLQQEWSGAQAFSSFDTMLAPFVKTDHLSYKEVKQAVQGFVYNMNVPSRWGGQCVSADTEALTEDGWKKYDEIRGLKIATFNMRSRKVEWLMQERVKTYDYDGELLCLKNRGQEQLVTPNHRVVRKRFNSDKIELVEAQEIAKFKTPILVPVSATTGSKKEIDDDLVRLYAWLVSEGTFSEDRRRVSIFQSSKNAKNCNEIRKCLRSLGFRWDETRRVHGFGKAEGIRFRLGQDSSRKIRKLISSKQVPEVIFKLSARQIRLFTDTYVKGDGHVEKKGRIRIYTKDPRVRDALQALCALCNYGTTIKRASNGVYSINVIRNQFVSIMKIFPVRYCGKVWCPTTRNGTFVARRNGKVFITGNSPFSNITLDWEVPEDLRDEKAIAAGQLQDFTYGECQDEADMINRALLEVMLGGDASGRVFTFPIPTYNITRDFDWDSENARLLFDMTAKYGLPYFQNFVNSSMKPSDVRAMCCRLQLDLRELRMRTNGLFGSGELTGSVGVVTINLPRIGFLSKDEPQLFERLGKVMDLAKHSLEIKRKMVQRNMDTGLMPFSRIYLGSVRNHFATIGIVGMNELLANFLGKNIASKDGKGFALKILDFMRARLKQYQEETGNLYNLEATPAESTAYDLARKDKTKYPEIITANESSVKNGSVPYYTNSTHLPVGYTDDLFKALNHQDELQSKYTGGTVLHAFLGERMPDPEACGKLVRKITSSYHLPYVTVTPTFSLCPTHGYVAGEHFNCDAPAETGSCGEKCEVYSRVVGYYRPVQQWNAGKQAEYRDRLNYSAKVVA